MARPPRHLVSGGVYHVMSRGNRREPIFLADGDRILFLELLTQIVRRRRWSVYGYCLMDNHYHLVVETPEPDLPSGMRCLNSEYAQWFNRFHGFVGHLFQGRYRALLVESDWHFLELARYMALNPVRAGLCGRPEEWPWGSYRAFVSGADEHFLATDKLLRFFGHEAARARAVLQRFVEDDVVRETRSLTATSGSDPDGGPAAHRGGRSTAN